MKNIHLTHDLQTIIGIVRETQNTTKTIEKRLNRLNQRVGFLEIEAEAMNGMVSDMDIDDKLKEVYPETYR